MNESTTRKEFIDVQLKDAGWNVNDHTQVVEEYVVHSTTQDQTREPTEKYKNNQFSDYVLLGKNGKPLAVIEAKKSTKDANIGREQAKQYCYNIQKETKDILPFCFYTNGHDIFFWDIEHAPPRKVVGYPTREDLERYLYIREAKKPLSSEFINTKVAGRDYQIRAIRSVMDGLEQKRRKFLIVMATGTGKTRTTIALVEALMRAGWAEKALFLVDRIALRDQALEAFKEHLPNEPRWPKQGEKSIAKDRRVYVSTYPTMLNIVREEKKTLSPHFFDLIVVDESHRSIYNTYKEVLDYFNTITIGLTATPTDVIDHNTFKIFNCEDGLPSFAYTYEEAVNNIPPYLCNFQVMKIKTKFQTEGISKRTVSLEDQKKLILEGKEIAEINFDGTELEKKVINKGTNTLIVKEFMEESIKDVNGVLPGKTIFFCVNIAHARRIEEIFNQLYPQYNGELAKVIVSEDSRVHGKGGLLDQFKNKDFPRIAISVDMLDTGIDVRELVNLVFAKPVYSYTKFWQMIGRGTRLLEPTQMKSWCTEKDVFLILDCWDNFEYFKLKPKGKELKQAIPIPVKLFGLRLDKLELAYEASLETTILEESKRLQQQIALLPANSVVIKDNSKAVEKVNTPEFWKNISNDKIDFLKSEILPLMRTVSGVDFKAMRFEKDVLEVSLAKMQSEDEKYDMLKDALIERIADLPLSLNIVAKQQELIKDSQRNYFWNNIKENDFNNLIDNLAPLARYIDTRDNTSGPSKFNFEDELVTKEMVEFGPQNEAVSITRYKEMVEEKIQELLESNPILQKIVEGNTISQEEIDALANELHEENPHITIGLLRRVYQNRKAKFLQFIKHILGLEVLETFNESVTKAFDTFIAEHSDLSSRQLQFLDILKKYILEKGNLDKRNLIESPFTMLHPDGIRGVFSPKEINEILQLTNNILAA
ncbi:restriction endonuclease subunit R [Tenacibaculum discolor]|uniref:DEAD/DEAH box helicase family protein n=1 Tax=Tenacibaculum discolor TaxID=361581 RepID=A0A2G1BYX3_9FLAO|nr:DEAD/DEAH box helicase family protein [Tenacibaculum discolor]MDP2541336.1 DEAD/DEAH box helicase family protein [Tenacibaculum discolor]PHN99204.1 restriction endonuclease subunit R [Tenacibaculum discolor]PHO01597.1 restriction endonuclease subunit R [Rhodobacteraceae bacterium 4F10]